MITTSDYVKAKNVCVAKDNKMWKGQDSLWEDIWYAKINIVSNPIDF
jgi:hypothetical protein